MNTNDDNFDLIEEIYLTQRQYIRWMCAETPRPDVFSMRSGKVVLKNMSADAQIRKQAPPPCELQLIVARMLGRPKDVSDAVISPPEPQPRIARKLERPGDAVWVFFKQHFLVIGVHDDGTVVARYVVDWCPNLEYRVTGDGTISYDRRVYDAEEFAMPTTGHFAQGLRLALKEWVKRAEGRKMPPGIKRLIKRIPEKSRKSPLRVNCHVSKRRKTTSRQKRTLTNPT